MSRAPSDSRFFWDWGLYFWCCEVRSAPKYLNYLFYCAKSWEAALVRFIFARPYWGVAT